MSRVVLIVTGRTQATQTQLLGAQAAVAETALHERQGPAINGVMTVLLTTAHPANPVPRELACEIASDHDPTASHGSAMTVGRRFSPFLNPKIEYACMPPAGTAYRGYVI
jgi:hypothetical protein